MKHISYTTNFGENRYLFPVKGGTFSLYPYDNRGNFRVRNGRVELLCEGVWKDVGELSQFSKEILAEQIQ